MCGRYVVAYDPQTLVDGFSLVRVTPFPRRYNVAPQSEVPVVHETREGERVGTLMRWGLVPHWAADPSQGARMNNARAEGLGDKPSFRQAVRKRRCLIPASGYYEWHTGTGADGKPLKQPWYISPAGGAPFFAFAGLFEAWRPQGSTDDADWLLTCSIVTTAPAPSIAHIHDRMPVIVEPGDWAAWLARDRPEPEHWGPLLRTASDARLQAWPVDRAVGRSSVEGPQLIEPIVRET
jgi:putative SOS response-associated peptidase YedK